jgi:hypothetical protein
VDIMTEYIFKNKRTNSELKIVASDYFSATSILGSLVVLYTSWQLIRKTEVES